MANPIEKEPAKPVVRDLIPTGVWTDWGEAFEDPDFGVVNGADGRDPTYVPGYSELRVQRDIQLAEAAKGQRPPRKVLTLPIELRWSKRAKASGAPDERKVQAARIAGFEPVTKADVGQSWLTKMPDGVVELADGSLQRGDTILMKRSPEKAALSAYRKQKATMERLGASMERATDLGMSLEKTTGKPVETGSRVNVYD